jgi:two-component system response regulator YesN
MSRLSSHIRVPKTNPEETPDSGHDGAATGEQPALLPSLTGEKRLRKVLRMIESEPSRSVSELALEVNLSPAHLQRLFKQKTGVHVSDLIVKHRLRKAARLLSTSDLPIKEIAHLVGYEHHSSFVRAFHRHFVQSPKHYRQQSGDSGSDSLQLVEKAAAD